MEQYLTKKINTTDIDDFIKLEAIFDYELVSKDIRGNKTYLTFKRETSTPYFEKIVELEKKWNKEMNYPAWPTYVLIALALITITGYLVVSFITGFENKLIFFLSIMLPGLLFFVLASLYFIFRAKKIEKILAIYYEKRREYQIEANKIKGVEEATKPKSTNS
ncbi:MAG: hypothetical protein IJQ67_05685 [Bacilli bacterium]|nr:hypothetical protein [Bacilli bacterium]